MTSGELRKEMKLIGVDDPDEEIKRAFIIDGLEHHCTCCCLACLACLREHQQSSQSSSQRSQDCLGWIV